MPLLVACERSDDRQIISLYEVKTSDVVDNMQTTSFPFASASSDMALSILSLQITTIMNLARV